MELIRRHRTTRAARGRLGAIALGLAVAVLVGFGAEAAVSPMETPPSPRPDAPPPPTSPPSTASPPSPLDVRPPQPAKPDPSVTVIRSDALETVSADSAGTLTSANGGLGVGMWLGTDRSVVDVMLPELPTMAPSPALRDLSRRLLLTAAAAPEGEAEPGALAVERVRLLRLMGESDGLRDLIEAMPRDIDAEIWRYAAEDRLLADDLPAACAMAPVQIERSQDNFWPKLLAFCQALAGETRQASLSIHLLEEAGEDDPAFFALFRALLGEEVSLDEAIDPDPLHVAMARAAKFDWPADVAVGDDLGVLRAFAVDPGLPLPRRLDAAERSHDAGALATDSLRQLYVDAEGATIIAPAAGNSGAAEAAAAAGLDAFYRRALAEADPSKRSTIVAEALAEAREQGLYFSTVRLFLPLVTDVAPEAIDPIDARELVQAALVAGDRELARAWYYAAVKQADGAGETDARVRAAVLDMTLLLRLALLLDGEVDFGQWWTLVRGDDHGRDRAARYLMLLAALGEPVPADHWEKLLNGPSHLDGPVAHPVIRHRLEQAAEAGRIGETVLLAAVALGDDGPATADLDALAAAVNALFAIGLEDEARALAIEAVALGS